MNLENKTNELLEAVTQLFMKLGIKSLTMDDISSHLGISKKTLYQFVSDKKDLVKKCLEYAINEDQFVLKTLSQSKHNAIDEIYEINKMVSEKLQNIQPSVTYDIQKYYPKAWQVMEDHKKCFVYEMIVQNLEKGIKQNLYRENINSEIIANVYVTTINEIFDSDIFPSHKYNFETLHREIARYHIRGIASKKGIAYLIEKLSNEKQQF